MMMMKMFRRRYARTMKRKKKRRKNKKLDTIRIKIVHIQWDYFALSSILIVEAIFGSLFEFSIFR